MSQERADELVARELILDEEKDRLNNEIDALEYRMEKVVSEMEENNEELYILEEKGFEV